MLVCLSSSPDSESRESRAPSRTNENQTEAAAETVTAGAHAVSSSLVFNSFPLINNVPADRPYLTALLTDDRDASGTDTDHAHKQDSIVAQDGKMDDDDNDVDNPYVRNVKMPKIEKKKR